MRFPLDEQKVGGYDYGVPTTYSKFHLGVDWRAKFVPLYAPKDGQVVKVTTGPQGGKTIWFKPLGEQTIIRWLHLDLFLVKQGEAVKEGTKLAITGNTGLSTSSHLHEDIWPKGEVTLQPKDTLNPHKYYEKKPMLTHKVLVLNIGVDIPSLDDYARAMALVEKITNKEFSVQFDIENYPYSVFPLTHEYSLPDVGKYFGLDPQWQKDKGIERPYYKVVQLCYEALKMYPDKRMLSMAFHEPVGTQQYNQTNGGFENDLGAVEGMILHEMCHSWHFYLGLPDITHDIIKKHNGWIEKALEELILLLKPHWPQLADKQGDTMEPIFKVQGNPTLYFAIGDLLVPFSVDFPTYQIDFAKNPIIELAASEFAKLRVAKSVKVVKA